MRLSQRFWLVSRMPDLYAVSLDAASGITASHDIFAIQTRYSQS